MPKGGTPEGGRAAAVTIKAVHGNDWYKRIGAKGGAAPHTKPRGFASMDTQAHKEASARGGSTSRKLHGNYMANVHKYADEHKADT